MIFVSGAQFVVPPSDTHRFMDTGELVVPSHRGLIECVTTRFPARIAEPGRCRWHGIGDCRHMGPFRAGVARVAAHPARGDTLPADHPGRRQRTPLLESHHGPNLRSTPDERAETFRIVQNHSFEADATRKGRHNFTGRKIGPWRSSANGGHDE